MKKIKRVLIAGCRNFNNYTVAKKYIDRCISNIRENFSVIILSGGADGADKLGERYAKENGFGIEYYLPDWKKYGRAAGPHRNKEMVEKADYIICFWDGKSRGTASTVRYTQNYGKPLRIKDISEYLNPEFGEH